MKHTKHDRSIRSTEGGSSMVIVTVLLAGLASLAVSLMTLTRSAATEQRGSREVASAIFVAEAGIAEAVLGMDQGFGGVRGSANAPLALSGGEYFVTQTDLGGGLMRLMATGRSGGSEARVELMLSRDTTNLFARGAFGDEWLTLRSNARTDSYNSTDGPYDSSTALQNGDVGSNGQIDLRSNARVYGDAMPGPGHSVVLHGSNVLVTGSTTPASAPVAMPPIVVPDIPLGPAATPGTTTWPSGNHGYAGLTLSNNSKLTVIGPATLVLGNFRARSNSELILDTTNGPVEIYVIDDFILNSNAQIYSLNKKPADVSFKLLSDNVIRPELEVDLDDIDFDSNSKIYGTVYAPNAEVVIDSNFELFGAIVARRLQLDSNSQVHFDEALMDSDSSSEVVWNRVSMRVLK